MGEYTGKGQGTLNTVLGSLGTAAFAGLDLNTIIDKLGGKNNIDPMVLMTMMNANKGNTGAADISAIIAALAPLVASFVSSGSKEEFVSQKEFEWAQKYNESEKKNAALEAVSVAREAATKAFTDASAYATGLVEKLTGVVSDITKTVIQQGQEVAVLKADIRCLSVSNEKDHAAIINGYQNAVALESERRKCGDENLYSYVNATFVPGKLVMPKSAICPPVESSDIDINVVLNALLTATGNGNGKKAATTAA